MSLINPIKVLCVGCIAIVAMASSHSAAEDDCDPPRDPLILHNQIYTGKAGEEIAAMKVQDLRRGLSERGPPFGEVQPYRS